jgi:hypothetical protein
MQRLAIILAAAGLLSLILPPAAPADEVYLKNGNHLSGRIVSMNAGKLVLDTDFAGRLSIDWDHVERLFSDAPINLVLLDGSTIRGVPVPADTPGLLRLTAEAGAEPVPVARVLVKAVNPPHEPPIKVNGRINVGLNKATGNSDRESGHADAEMIARAANHRPSLGGAYNRAKDDGRESEDNASGFSKYD